MDELSRYICFNLGRAIRRIHKYYEPKLSPFGLTPPQYFVFHILWMKDGISFSELGELVHLDNSTLTGIIDRMEKSGYVERRPNPEDRRSILIFLTSKAYELGPQILKIADELDDILRKPFSQEKMSTFEQVLKTLPEVFD